MVASGLVEHMLDPEGTLGSSFDMNFSVKLALGSRLLYVTNLFERIVWMLDRLGTLRCGPQLLVR